MAEIPVQLTGKPVSLDLCASECGAKCCRAPGHVQVTPPEMRRLKDIAKQRKVKIAFLNTPFYPGKFVLDFDRNGVQCPFLGADYACTIYEDRPEACRSFPNRPVMGCLVWPGNDPLQRVEVHETTG